jgi:glycosyltransferase involved in cell wall biosynthesis
MARIAFVDLLFNWPPAGGSWVDVRQVAAGLSRAGHTVELFVPRFQDYYPRGRIEEDPGFVVHGIQCNRFTYNVYTFGKRLTRALESFSPDVVFLGDGYFMKGALLPYLTRWPVILRFYAYELLCYNLHYYLYEQQRVCDGNFIENPARCHSCWYKNPWTVPRQLLEIVFGREDRHPALHFSQEYFFSLAFTRYYREHLGQWIGRAAAVVTYNDFTRQTMSRYNSNVLRIPSGVDTSRFYPAKTPLENESPAILMSGRVNDPLKGFATVRRACDRLWEEGRRFRLLITEQFPVEGQAPYLEKLGWFSQEQLPDLYRRCDISLVPSIWMEPFGITALESMASGLPVIASRIGGLETSVVDGETGFLIQPDDSDALAEKLALLLDDPQLRRKLGSAGRKRAEEVFNWDTLVKDNYLPLVDQLSRLAPEASEGYTADRILT